MPHCCGTSVNICSYYGMHLLHRWLIDRRPIQVKQSENIGRNAIDNFKTAIRRVKKDRGVVVAFSFGKGAYEEVARVRLEDGLDIELGTVEEMLKEE